MAPARMAISGVRNSCDSVAGTHPFWLAAPLRRARIVRAPAGRAFVLGLFSHGHFHPQLGRMVRLSVQVGVRGDAAASRVSRQTLVSFAEFFRVALVHR